MRIASSSLSIALLGANLLGCAHGLAPGLDSRGHITPEAMDRVEAALQHYQEYLRFEAVPDRTVVAQHEQLVITYSLRNLFSEPIAACFGEAGGYTFFAPRRLEQRLGPSVDHPSCRARFTVSPNQPLTWTETIEVLPAGPGTTQFYAHLQIIHPKDCDIYGCYDLLLKSTPVELTLRPSPP